MTPEITKFNPEQKCTKCGHDKFSTRFEEQPTIDQDRRRRERLGWPTGELIVQSCQLCSHTIVSRPLDYQEPKHD